MSVLDLTVALVAKKLSAFCFKFQTYQTDRRTTGRNKIQHCTTAGRAQWIEGTEGKQVFVRKMDGWMDGWMGGWMGGWMNGWVDG